MNKIVYGGRTFTDHEIESGNLHLATSLTSAQLEANTFTAVVRSQDPTLSDFERNTQLTFFRDDRQVCIVYVQTIDRIAADRYKIYATSAVGLLIEDQHMGGIYTGQTAQEVITDICGTVPFIIKSNLEGVKLYGWLPIASTRDNLSQVLFAIGAALKTDLDGILRIEGLWDGISSTVSKSRMYEGAKMDYEGKVTQVIVTEHQYVPWTEEEQLFEGTAQQGDIITFDEPMHSLTANGFTILDSGANWAKVSAGSGVLTGRNYIHNTRQITKDVFQARDPNVKTVKDATLVSLVNSQACAQRLADYYKCRERVDASVVYHGEAPGDRLATYHPFDKTGVDACLESADITLSGTLKAQEKSLVGFVPKQIEQVVTFNRMEVLTKSGTWAVPDGVYQIRVVCIGGGNGAPSGLMGKPNQPGTYSSASWGPGTESAATNYYRAYSPSKGGDGGEGSQGALGGKIYSETIEVTPGQEISVVIGAGGVGGNGNNSKVDEAVPGNPGGATIFGALSSESGSSSKSGYLEEITGVIYAVQGGSGIAGQAGVTGYGETYFDDWDNQTKLDWKYTIPDPLVFKGVSYTAGQAQKSESAYYSEGGSWDSITGTVSYGRGRGLGGGAAAGVNGPSTSSTKSAGARGAKPIKPPAPTNRGNGGNGGHGGGGAGGNGGSESHRRRKRTVTGGDPTAPSMNPVTTLVEGGFGGDGGDGAPGCVIVYYGVQEKIQSGQFLDKNGKTFLDHFSRRLIV